MRFVLDASVTLTWLFADRNSSSRRYSESVLAALRQPQVHADVPVTWGLEIANAIRRAESRGDVLEAQSAAFLEMLSVLSIHADEATFVRSLDDTLAIARRYRLSSYDASYLELALRAGASLASLDEDLVKAGRSAGVKRFTGA
ncbi:MAG TPA: type II toxin-antitoxin system VapC family toxin [Casimicrobiaceae bacterium]|nr:type II toxin-antitoxin system VapC family toxin [Casimicrobiaceae bacterium]